MYALRVQTSDGSSSAGSDSYQSLVLDDPDGPRRAPPLLRDPPPASPSASASSWVNKIGSTMFNKIKVAPTDQPRAERPPQYALPLPSDELRIAISPSKHDDREDAKPVLAKAGSLGQSLDFIKVYCSPKRQPSPKIKPSIDSTKQRRPPRMVPTPILGFEEYAAHDDDDDDDDENDDDENDGMRRSSPKRASDVVPTHVVPVLQSFFARPKVNPRAKSNSIQSVDKRIHRQEQYKRDLNRHDELRSAHATQRQVDAQLVRIEAWKQQMRSLKRQRLRDVQDAKQVLLQRQAHEASLVAATRDAWEAAFEDDVAQLSAAFAKIKRGDDRPMTTAGSAMHEATSIVERDKALATTARAQTAPLGDKSSSQSRHPRFHAVDQAISERSRPNSSSSNTTEKSLTEQHSWVETCEDVLQLDGDER
ncbi:hypothetical protein SPRG_06394 [Saprolegnia parasitica CBS 223.65]|uniref:Uncharacterized protein n=1 Tax=Saprolegnia parasitica (strain CBS 223.65) TaxID=695850 RepID=A0A067CPR1_SAPPC|nr:hypothetical protein SPRG_06394 [Saprolegnia parasitica CBS 223.65]KDO28536.1 hypothetical protein SPRG_06394 [Saprolegnia parasitica CBS 223.65]|eukprot:XP_012200602.1 hypothetical protein SPRG_06394 [Saprolegnia parasitica CBS 223.65]